MSAEEKRGELTLKCMNNQDHFDYRTNEDRMIKKKSLIKSFGSFVVVAGNQVSKLDDNQDFVRLNHNILEILYNYYAIQYKGPFDIVEGTRDKKDFNNIFIAASSFDVGLNFPRGQVVRFYPEHKLKFFYEDLSADYETRGAFTVEYFVGEQTPTAVFVTVENTVVSFKEASSLELYVFSNTIIQKNIYPTDGSEPFEFKEFLTQQVSSKYLKLHTETEIKIHQYLEESTLTYVSVTKQKNIYVQHPLSSSAALRKKELVQLSPEDILMKALFITEGKYVVACATKIKCLVVDFTVQEGSRDRLIVNGFEIIGDLFVIANQSFFGVTEPQKKIISFYVLEEKPCFDKNMKTCDPYSTFLARSCNANYINLDGKCICPIGR